MKLQLFLLLSIALPIIAGEKNALEKANSARFEEVTLTDEKTGMSRTAKFLLEDDELSSSDDESDSDSSDVAQSKLKASGRAQETKAAARLSQSELARLAASEALRIVEQQAESNQPDEKKSAPKATVRTLEEKKAAKRAKLAALRAKHEAMQAENKNLKAQKKGFVTTVYESGQLVSVVKSSGKLTQAAKSEQPSSAPDMAQDVRGRIPRSQMTQEQRDRADALELEEEFALIAAMESGNVINSAAAIAQAQALSMYQPQRTEEKPAPQGSGSALVVIPMKSNPAPVASAPRPVAAVPVSSLSQIDEYIQTRAHKTDAEVEMEETIELEKNLEKLKSANPVDQKSAVSMLSYCLENPNMTAYSRNATVGELLSAAARVSAEIKGQISHLLVAHHLDEEGQTVYFEKICKFIDDNPPVNPARVANPAASAVQASPNYFEECDEYEVDPDLAYVQGQATNPLFAQREAESQAALQLIIQGKPTAAPQAQPNHVAQAKMVSIDEMLESLKSNDELLVRLALTSLMALAATPNGLGDKNEKAIEILYEVSSRLSEDLQVTANYIVSSLL